MPNWLRALIAGYGAKKLGGGCFSTILIFIVIYYALGKCNQSPAPVQRGSVQKVAPAKSAALIAGKQVLFNAA
jgi:hypothetical protein